MGSLLPTIRWRKPKLARFRFAAAKAFLGVAPAPLDTLRDALAAGIPEMQDAATPKADALGLLQLAAEVEHALLVQYLYAASSLPEDGNTETKTAREKVKTVAIQEMGHLITVQNLLLALGGTNYFHIGRDGLRARSELNPIAFSLEPLSSITLAQYIVAEMPAQIPKDKPELRRRVENIRAQAIAATGIEPHRVGALYAAIYWLFQPTDSAAGSLALNTELGFREGWHVSPADFSNTALIDAHQAQLHEWHANEAPNVLVKTVSNATDALAAIASITEQGEGLGGIEESHFSEFLDTLTLFENGKLMVLPVPPTPFIAPQPAVGARQSTPITHPYTRLWARLFNIHYTTLLLDIGHAMSLSRSKPDEATDRTNLIAFAFSNMRQMIGASGIGGHLMTLNMTEQENAPKAAATFELLYEDLPPSQLGCWQRQAALLAEEASAIADLRAHAAFSADSDGSFLLEETIEPNSLQRRQLVQARLGNTHT
jgi:hypothetical protein